MKTRYNKWIHIYFGLIFSLWTATAATALAAYPAIDGDNSLEWITNVTFNTIDNDTLADAGGYGDYTTITTTVAPGATHALSVTIDVDTGNKISAFFDWNRNELFTDPGEEVMVTPNIIQTPDPTYTATVDVNIPANANLGTTRMRVVLSHLNGDSDPVQSSGTLPGGEAEDYTIVIDNGSAGPVITATAGPNGSIDPMGGVNVASGADQPFTITPDSGFFIDDVLVDGSSVGAVSAYTFTNVLANHTIHAAFSASLNHTISAATGINGTINPIGAVKVGHGSSQTFFIQAASGFRVADVLVDGGSAGPVSSYTFTNVVTGHSIVAAFTADSGYPAVSSSDFSKEWITHVAFGTISNSSNAEGYGSFLDLNTEVQQGGVYPIGITIHPQADENISVFIDWNQNGVFTDPGEETVVASFTHEAGPHFASISVPAGALLGTARMRVVLRYFEPPVSAGDLAANQSGGEAEDYTINVAAPVPAIISSAGANGTIDPVGMIPLNSGDDLSLTITSDPGFFIRDLLVDGVTVGEPFPTSYTFTNVTVTHTIHATFADIPIHKITSTAGANGTISPSGVIDVLEGSNEVFSMTPASGYQVADVLVDSASIGPLISYTFTNVNANHTITAIFSRIPPFPWAIYLPGIIKAQQKAEGELEQL